MSTTTQVQKVKLNKMTKARYEDTTPVATEFYMLTDVLDPQYDVLPTADAKYAGQITQYTGESVDGGYTNGYFYKCTAQGTSPETYAWEQADVQPSGGAVDSVNGQTGTVVLDADDVGALSTDGGTVNGEVTISGPNASTVNTVLTLKCGNTDTNPVVVTKNRASKDISLLDTSLNVKSLNPLGGGSIGGKTIRWSTIYVNKINANTSYAEDPYDITVPKVNGTMAVSTNDSTATTGQVLTKTAAGAEWADASGGTAVIFREW